MEERAKVPPKEPDNQEKWRLCKPNSPLWSEQSYLAQLLEQLEGDRLMETDIRAVLRALNFPSRIELGAAKNMLKEHCYSSVVQVKEPAAAEVQSKDQDCTSTKETHESVSRSLDFNETSGEAVSDESDGVNMLQLLEDSNAVPAPCPDCGRAVVERGRMSQSTSQARCAGCTVQLHRSCGVARSGAIMCSCCAKLLELPFREQRVCQTRVREDLIQRASNYSASAWIIVTQRLNSHLSGLPTMSRQRVRARFGYEQRNMRIEQLICAIANFQPPLPPTSCILDDGKGHILSRVFVHLDRLTVLLHSVQTCRQWRRLLHSKALEDVWRRAEIVVPEDSLRLEDGLALAEIVCDIREEKGLSTVIRLQVI